MTSLSTCGCDVSSVLPQPVTSRYSPGTSALVPVVDAVVDPAEAHRGTEAVALAGVVVDDVEDDLDARGMQPLHHRAELGHRLSGLGREARVGREVRERVVAPVIGQTARHEGRLVGAGVHGHELDGGDAERS